MNQSQTRRHELDAGYLWSDAPQVALAQIGEIVYVHSGGRIGMLGLVAGAAFPARRAAPGGPRGARRGTPGWRVPVHFEELLRPLRPKDHLAAFKALLPPQHSPLRASGDANSTVYLTRIDERVAGLLRRLLGGQVEELLHMAPTLRSAERADDVAEHALRARVGLDAGTCKRLLAARRGLGVYRENVERHEQACRLSGLLDRRHLRARHIKPWRECNDREKLDGSNGLLLSPHFDQLFERGLISFADDGGLLVARHLNPAVLPAWGVRPPRNVGAFTPGQCAYLAYHRLKVFEQPAGGRRALDEPAH
ncbi:MAG: HNH endonuclease [Gammaproteobacteria bacterium]|nr:HNH endonuclease [Gammaproteobacteria bacterium]